MAQPPHEQYVTNKPEKKGNRFFFWFFGTKLLDKVEEDQIEIDQAQSELDNLINSFHIMEVDITDIFLDDCFIIPTEQVQIEKSPESLSESDSIWLYDSEKLPDEVLLECFRYLDIKSLNHTRRTCDRWSGISIEVMKNRNYYIPQNAPHPPHPGLFSSPPPIVPWSRLKEAAGSGAVGFFVGLQTYFTVAGSALYKLMIKWYGWVPTLCAYIVVPTEFLSLLGTVACYTAAGALFTGCGCMLVVPLAFLAFNMDPWDFFKRVGRIRIIL
eukprot:TRINITY_DN14132_c0_g1_i1.p1 TRINITY_DN14132_c0_g1~~TRINITY_DN14132_c0_g1_i1.p1  ORF type:complete len:270 (+),score=27.09 TRINITY_DN14132_c0_g1_i1:40-849(+)